MSAYLDLLVAREKLRREYSENFDSSYAEKLTPIINDMKIVDPDIIFEDFVSCDKISADMDEFIYRNGSLAGDLFHPFILTKENLKDVIEAWSKLEFGMCIWMHKLSLNRFNSYFTTLDNKIFAVETLKVCKALPHIFYFEASKKNTPMLNEIKQLILEANIEIRVTAKHLLDYWYEFNDYIHLLHVFDGQVGKHPGWHNQMLKIDNEEILKLLWESYYIYKWVIPGDFVDNLTQPIARVLLDNPKLMEFFNPEQQEAISSLVNYNKKSAHK